MTTPTNETIWSAFRNRAGLAQQAEKEGLLDGIIFLEAARRARYVLEERDLIKHVPNTVRSYIDWIARLGDQRKETKKVLGGDEGAAFEAIWIHAHKLIAFLRKHKPTWRRCNLRRTAIQYEIERLVARSVRIQELLTPEDDGWRWYIPSDSDSDYDLAVSGEPTVGFSSVLVPFVCQTIGETDYTWMYAELTLEAARAAGWRQRLNYEELRFVAEHGLLQNQVVITRTYTITRPDGEVQVTFTSPAPQSEEATRLLAEQLLWNTDIEDENLARTRTHYEQMRSLRIQSCGEVPELTAEMQVRLLAARLQGSTSVEQARARNLTVTIRSILRELGISEDTLRQAVARTKRLAPSFIRVRGQQYPIEYIEHQGGWPAVIELALDEIEQVDLTDDDLRSRFAKRGYRIAVGANPVLNRTMEEARDRAARIKLNERLTALEQRTRGIEAGRTAEIHEAIAKIYNRITSDPVETSVTAMDILQASISALEAEIQIQRRVDRVSVSLRRLPRQGSRKHSIAAEDVQRLFQIRNAIEDQIEEGDLPGAESALPELEVLVEALVERIQPSQGSGASRREQARPLTSFQDLAAHIGMFRAA